MFNNILVADLPLDGGLFDLTLSALLTSKFHEWIVCFTWNSAWRIQALGKCMMDERKNNE